MLQNGINTENPMNFFEFFCASHVYQLIPLGELNVCQLVFSVHSYVKNCCQHLHYLTNEPTSLGFCTAIIEAAEEFYECT